MDEVAGCSALAWCTSSLPASRWGVPSASQSLSSLLSLSGLEGDDLFRLKCNSRFIVWLL